MKWLQTLVVFTLLAAVPGTSANGTIPKPAPTQRSQPELAAPEDSWPQPLWSLGGQRSSLISDVPGAGCAQGLAPGHLVTSDPGISVRGDSASVHSVYVFDGSDSVTRVLSFRGIGRVDVSQSAGVVLWHEVLAVSRPSTLTACDLNGGRLWSTSTTWGYSSISPLGDVAFVSGYRSFDGPPGPLGASMILTASGVTHSLPAIGTHSPPLWSSDGEHVYVVSEDNSIGQDLDRLLCFSGEGVLEWSVDDLQHIPSPQAPCRPSVTLGRGILACNHTLGRGRPPHDRTLTVLDDSGSVLWQHRPEWPDGVVAAAVSADGSTVYEVVSDMIVSPNRPARHLLLRSHDARSGEVLGEAVVPPWPFEGENWKVGAIAPSPDGSAVCLSARQPRQGLDSQEWPKMSCVFNRACELVTSAPGFRIDHCLWVSPQHLSVAAGETTRIYCIVEQE